MASPFKTHETMDLARALLEEDLPCFRTSVGVNNNEEDNPKQYRRPLDPNDFDNLVITKDSSTELIPTQLVQSSTDSTKKIRNKPALMMVRDMNAGKGLLDDDGKPVVGKVFSRVIQISGPDSNKPKQLKAHHRGRSSSSCRDRQGHEKERSSSARPQSSNANKSRQGGHSGGGNDQQCPSCNQKISDETMMEHHIVFCSGSSKEIM